MPEPTPIKSSPALAADFDAFWFWYPKKIDKALAKVKWQAITNGGLSTCMLDRDSNTYISIELSATPAEIIAGLRRWRKTIVELKTEPKFIPAPSVWLNRGRWMDES